MTVIAVSKVNWGVQTIHNVTSITFNGTVYTVAGDSSYTFNAGNYFIRIME